MPTRDIRITRPHTFVEEIIKFCGNSKYVIGAEIGGKTNKEHFHVYLDIDSNRSHNWTRELKSWKDKVGLKGNEDIGTMKHKPKDWLYVCKGDDPNKPPKTWSNFLTPDEILLAQRNYWFLQSEVKEVKSENVKVESENVKVESESDVVKVLRLKLDIEREKSRRKSMVKVDIKKVPFEEYIVTEFEKYVEQNEIKYWNADEVNKLDEFVVSKFADAKKPVLFDYRPMRQYRNYLLYRVDKKLAMQYINNNA